jgi:hypothetical protein
VCTIHRKFLLRVHLIVNPSLYCCVRLTEKSKDDDHLRAFSIIRQQQLEIFSSS